MIVLAVRGCGGSTVQGGGGGDPPVMQKDGLLDVILFAYTINCGEVALMFAMSVNGLAARYEADTIVGADCVVFADRQAVEHYEWD